MEQNSNKKLATAGLAMRRCLCCSSRFWVTSPYLRICDVCKAGEEWESGNVDIALHQPGMPANDN